MKISMHKSPEEIIREDMEKQKREKESAKPNDNNLSINDNKDYNNNKINNRKIIGSKFTKGIVIACFLVGCLCIFSGILKSWFGSPNNIDWGLLFVGLVLCGISLFRDVKIGKEELAITFQDFRDELYAVKESFIKLLEEK